MELLLTIILATGLTALAIMLFMLPALRRARSGDDASLPESRMTAEDLIRSGREPLLYLRPFSLEGNDAGDRPAFRGAGFRSQTVEAEVLGRLRDEGPVVSIGYPGERMIRDFGAARAQCPREGWDDFILKWMAQASLLVVVLGKTSGMEWLIEAIIRRGHLSRCLFIVNEDVAPPAILLEYLRRSLREHGRSIDLETAANCVVCFDAELRAVVIRENLSFRENRRVRVLDEALDYWRTTHAAESV